MPTTAEPKRASKNTPAAAKQTAARPASTGVYCPAPDTGKSIGRPRTFDEETVLEAALQQFWRRGYEGTSLAHLTTATGLHKGSLYQAFGDKKSLFIKCLQYYLDKTYHRAMTAVKPGEPPLNQLRALLHVIVGFATADDEYRSGCLAVNTMVEMAPHDDNIQDLMETAYAKRIGTLSRLITAAQECGQLNTKLPAEHIAEMICTLVAGLSATLKSTLSEREAHDIADRFMKLIV